MKKITSIFLALVLVMTALLSMPLSASAQEVFGDYEYNVLEDGTVEITDYIGFGEDIVIPSVIDGKAVTSIGWTAFYGRESLKNVVISEGIKHIGYAAFYACFNMHSVTLPESLLTIATSAFSYMGLQGDIIIPSGVTSLGDDSPFWRTDLDNIFVDEENQFYKDIDGVLFDKSGEQLIKYPSGNSRTSYTIPNGTKGIAAWAFLFSDNLTEIIFSNSITEIEHEAFFGCAFLKNFAISASVTNIGENAFGYSHNYDKIDGVKIYCYENTVAHQYAIENEIEFELLICREHSDKNGDGKCDDCNADVISNTCACCSKHNHGNNIIDKILCFICRILQILNRLFA